MLGDLFLNWSTKPKGAALDPGTSAEEAPGAHRGDRWGKGKEEYGHLVITDYISNVHRCVCQEAKSFLLDKVVA
jgi:hypothetical protein